MHPFITLLISSGVITAAIFDYKYQKIPNFLTFSITILSFFYYATLLDSQEIIGSFLGCFTGLGLFLIPYLMGWMGAGDTKLLAAIGACVGVKGVISVSILTSLAGGLYGLFFIGFKCLQSKEALVRLHSALYCSEFLPQLKILLWSQTQAKHKISYGVIIAAGTLCHLFLEINCTDVFKILF
ncbi:MAG: prepilin peptidase [Deltaproteobacteria bacterium]|jgi:prepilin peptidase CpaA|nr:prepilin peptidase [Deltaproteobacteria bacterium]